MKIFCDELQIKCMGVCTFTIPKRIAPYRDKPSRRTSDNIITPAAFCNTERMSASISQPFIIATVPKQTAPTPVLVASHGLSAETNSLNVAISRYSISQYVINPSPKLVKSNPIPSNLTVTAFDDQVYATRSNKNTFTLHLDENTNIELKSQVVNCLSYKQNDTVLTTAILEDGTILKYKDTNMISKQSVPYSEIDQVEFIDNKYALLISKTSSALYDLSHMTELRSSTALFNNDPAMIQIRQFRDKIYKYDLKEQYFEIFSLTTLNEIHSIPIPFLTFDKDTKYSFIVVSDNRIVLANNNELYLLDLFLGSVITHNQFKNLKWIDLIAGARDGAFTIGLCCNNSANSISLNIINLELGSGNLKDSLGRGFMKFNKNEQKINKLSLKPLLNENSERNNNNNKIKSNNTEFPYDYDNIFKQLVSNVNDQKKFDKTFFESFKIENDFYTEKDRYIIDQDFLSQVIEIILKNYEFDDEKSIYPKTLTFLLTHPLFPIDKSKEILPIFKNVPVLYKQVIVTCPNLPLNYLLNELFTIKNNELSLDISLRILQDFTKDSIKQELKKLSKIDINNFIRFIINNNKNENEETRNIQITPQLFQLLSIVIDSIGLFALDSDLLTDLAAYIDSMVKLAESNTELWYLLDSKTTVPSSNQSHSTKNYNNKLQNSKSQRKALPTYSIEYLEI